MKEMTPEVRKVFRCMLLAFFQYADMSDVLIKYELENNGGKITFAGLSHGMAAAGISLAKMLSEYGLANHDVLSFSLTDAGLALLNEG